MGRAAVVAAAAVVGLLLSGCTAERSAAPRTAAPRSSASASPVVDGNADAELARFARDAAAVVRRQRDPDGGDFVRALERAGWSHLQVTADRTSAGLDAPAVQFAVRERGSCLIGQYGRPGLQVLRAAPVNGACLIGGVRDAG